MTPETLQTLFDANWIIISFVVGILWKYLPALKGVTNNAIPWVNFALYVVTKLVSVFAVPDAQAAGFDVAGTVPNVVGILLGGFTSATWARQLYEGFGRHILTKWLGR